MVRTQRPLVQVGGHRGQRTRHVVGLVAVLGRQQRALHQLRVLEHQLGGDPRVLVQPLRDERVLHALLLRHQRELRGQVGGKIRKVVVGVEGGRQVGRLVLGFDQHGVLERLQGGHVDLGLVLDRRGPSGALLVVVVLLELAVEGAGAVLGHVDDQAVHLGEGLRKQRSHEDFAVGGDLPGCKRCNGSGTCV